MEFNFEVLQSSSKKRKIVRISYKLMEKLGIEIGDIVYIRFNQKRTPVIVAPQDNQIDFIAIDPIVKDTLHLSKNDTIKVEKIDTDPIKNGTMILSIDLDYGDKLGNKIKNALLPIYSMTPFSEGDIFSISIGDEITKIRVQKTSHPIIKFTNKTNIRVRSTHAFDKLPPLELENIGGLKKVKELIRTRILLPLEHPEIFENFKNNISPPRGVLLHGPPGTGKTMIMKAVASRFKDCTFIEISASDIFSKYYGEGEKKISELFDKARKQSPSIIFIDEFDAISSKRSENGGDMEKRVVGKFLSEMDGLKDTEKVIVIASTNRPNVIDEAFRRPRRFDYEIEFTPPDKNDRLEILKIHTSHIKMDRSVDLKEIAEKTHGYVGADLYGLVTESVIQAITRNLPSFNLDRPIPQSKLKKIKLHQKDFEKGMDLVKPSVMRDVEISTIDYTFNHVVGLEEAKRSLEESVIWKLDPPEKIKELNINLPSNVLLYGPPGCGKTLLGKSIANESGINFIYVKAPEIMKKWVGESAKTIRDIFRKAKRAEPSIVFIDEIDAISITRSREDNSNSLQVLSQLLIDVDNSTNHQISVIAATNQPYLVDPALTRSGRFDYQIYIDLPNEKNRKDLFEMFCQDIPHEKINWEKLVKLSNGFTPSDIKTAVRFAIADFVRSDNERITESDLIHGCERVVPSTTEHALKKYRSYQQKNVVTKDSRLYM